MDSSPTSTVSSDLYSPSEPLQSKANLHQAKDGSPSKTVLQPSLDNAQHKGEHLEYSDTMQGLESVGDEASRPSSTVGSVGPDGMASDLSHKRKREQDGEHDRSFQEYSTFKDQIDGIPFPRKSDNMRSVEQVPSTREPSTSIRDQSRIKRSKTSDHVLARETGSQLFSKSSALPAVLWQHIFCFVPPVFLGRLLRVNHAFNAYLMPGKIKEELVLLRQSIIQPLKAEAIWMSSRKRFCPGLPKPIGGVQELDMWRLLRGSSCQICGEVKAASSAPNSERPWESGPGGTGVRVVWPFGVRCCGPCLQNISKKEMGLSLSSDCPFFLLQALPFAFVSEENHYIGHNILRNNTAPPTLRMTKHYYKPHIEEIKHQLEVAKELGAASAEEWSKGLARQGQERLEDVMRWEQWEAKGGLRKVNSRPLPKAVLSGIVNAGNRNPNTKGETNSDRSTPQSMGFPLRSEADPASPVPLASMDSAQTSQNIVTSSIQPPWAAVAPYTGGAQHGGQPPFYQPRPERNIRDVNEAKAARRAEIERRCAAMHPPLLPSVLSHMDSFQAAMQISQPLTDQAWQVLQPRLLAQLPYAERREKERAQQHELLAEEYRQRRQQEAQLKETRENFDREWETFQAPVRTRIGALADEIIDARWAQGNAVTKETSPRFAADILLHVRQRFYADIAREDKAALVAGETVKADSANGPPTRRLILENMKWLFETKIKPRTDHFQKELFLCSACDSNFKFYGFEGVIQHYAAKHTTTLSMGNIIVHWRAEWPETPPFNPNPSPAKAAYYKVPTPAIPSLQDHPPIRDSHGTTSFGTYSQGGETGIAVAPQRHNTALYPVEAYADSYGGPHQEAARPSVPLQQYSGAPTVDHDVGASYSSSQSGYANGAGNYSSFPTGRHGQVTQSYASSFPGQQTYSGFAQGHSSTVSQGYVADLNMSAHAGYPPAAYPSIFSNGPLASNPSSLDFGRNVTGQVSDLYQRQMDEMAKHAKDVFTGIGGIKDLPGSVRIHVVIQHTISRFKATFPNEPSLSMFIDGLDRNAVMRPVRSVNGLGCKTCIKTGTGAKLYTLPHLVNHFRTIHVENTQTFGYPQYGLQAPERDWKHDMIDLPDLSKVSNLVNASGMTDSKLALIAWAFPEAFPSPLPRLRGAGNTGPLPIYRRDLDLSTRGFQDTQPSAIANLPHPFHDQSDEHDNFRPYSAFRPLSQAASSEPLEPPGEDEYDPHRPAYWGKLVKIEPSSNQLYKADRPSTLTNGHESSFQSQQGSPNYKPPNGIEPAHPYYNASPSRTQVSDQRSGQLYEPSERLAQPQSPKIRATSRSDKEYEQRDSDQIRSSRQVKLNEHDVLSEFGKGYRHAPDQGQLVDDVRSSRHAARTASPQEGADAADRFLSKLAPGSGDGHHCEPASSDREAENPSTAPWREERPVKRQQQYFPEDGAYEQVLGASNVKKRLESVTPLQQQRPVLSQSVNGSHTFVSQRSGLSSQYREENRPSSHVKIPLKPARTGESPSVAYNIYGDARQAVTHELEDHIGHVTERPPSQSRSYHLSRISEYGGRSRSPPGPEETALYRPRSPVEEDRRQREPVYRVHSPSPRREIRSQRVLSYNYPTQNRYEYIDDRGLADNHYQQQVEYVPVRYETHEPVEPARYIIARPTEQISPGYERYGQRYVEEPVYEHFERNGQVYRVPQRVYEEQQGRAAPPSAHSYKY